MRLAHARRTTMGVATRRASACSVAVGAASALAALLFATPVRADPELVAMDRVQGMAYAPSSDLLYISTESGRIERYDVTAGGLLEPFRVGVDPRGIDLSPDASVLYVTEGTRGLAGGFLYAVDTTTGIVQAIHVYELDRGEEGSEDVVAMSASQVFMTTDYGGSGDVPFRELDPTAGTFVVRTELNDGEVEDSSVLRTNATRSVMVLSEAGSSAGQFWVFDPLTDSFEPGSTGSSNRGVDVSPDGSLIAIGHGGGFVGLYSPDASEVATLTDTGTRALVFDPSADELLVVDWDTDALTRFSTTTFVEVGSVPIGQDVVPGDVTVIEIAPDGSQVFLGIEGGMRIVPLP